MPQRGGDIKPMLPYQPWITTRCHAVVGSATRSVRVGSFDAGAALVPRAAGWFIQAGIEAQPGDDVQVRADGAQQLDDREAAVGDDPGSQRAVCSSA
jgi:hypothetical protein